MLIAAGLILACAADSDAADSEENVMEEVANAVHPGAEAYPDELQERIGRALAAKGPEYEPRTHHLLEDGSPKYTNRLIFEDSPYLVQHAHNPVDWYPWGPEAFERAKREDKPIFLSIGYSTCHWCHVMERESFESEEIARLVNERFVAIKMDRERRPDVDELYMTAVQLLTGRGGWPMSSFLTPEGKPFFGGTYFPPSQFSSLLQRVDDAWHAQRAQLLQSADQITARVEEVTASRGRAAEVGRGALDLGARQILQRHDATLGGFGRAPKFPHESELLYLFERTLRHGDEEALAAAAHSLDAMAAGGIYDQIGGGFHRYSTDARWLVPHFEKMLYNQAHLSRAYLDSYRLTGNRFHARVARQTLDYVLREMTDPGGGFYSATDADSEGEEGVFFVWTPDELRAALAPPDADLAIELWGVTEAGNFEGHNILYLPQALESVATSHDMPLAAFLERVDAIRERLWQVREEREHPLRDDKFLTAWNGMMITAFAQGDQILGEERYLEAGRQAAELLWTKNRREDGSLWRVHLEGSSSIPALQDDYAYFAEALVALYDATAEARWLERARAVADVMLERFWDSDGGGFFMNEGSDPLLIGNPKSPADGAIPSGNSVAVRVLARLADRTGETTYRDRAVATVSTFAESLEKRPSAFAYLLSGLDEILHGGAGPLQYGAGGTVKAAAALTPDVDDFNLTVDLEIRDGWHVNAHRPLQEELIPTVLTVDGGRGDWQLQEVEYPEGETVRLSFQEEPLLVYHGREQITVRLSGAAAGPAAVVPVRLRIQACNDRVCLRPEELVLEVPAAL